MKIAVNPGHTLTGVGTGASSILSETGENRKIGKRVIELLKANGQTVVDCTIDKSSNDLRDAVNKANSNNVDLFVSIHFNAGGGEGTETHIHARGGTAETYAKRVNDKIVASCGFKNRGIRVPKEFLGYDLYVLKNTNMPAILIEVCFVDSSVDAKKLNTEKVSIAIVEGILNKTIGATTPPADNNSNNSSGLYNATVVNVNSYLMVRPSPGSSTEIGQVYNNERVQAFEEKDGYRRIKYDTSTGKLNKEGWVTSKYVKLDEAVPKTPYRVRKSWDDVASQLGAFSDLENAKKCADENPGYHVFDNTGALVYSSAAKQIVVGSKVKIIGTHYATGQVVSDWAKSQILTVEKIVENKALLQEITSWCYLKDLSLV